MNATAWAGQAAHADHSESTCIQLFGKIYMIDPTHEIVLFAWRCGGQYAEEAPISQDKWEGSHVSGTLCQYVFTRRGCLK